MATITIRNHLRGQNPGTYRAFDTRQLLCTFCRTFISFRDRTFALFACSFRSRFVRSHQQDDASDNEQSRVRFYEKEKEKERERVLDTEDVSRGSLSGIIRLADSPVRFTRADTHRITNP